VLFLAGLCLQARPLNPQGLSADNAGAQAPASTSSNAATVVPRLVQFSGTVTDSSGKPATGTVAITFSLYELQEGGSPLWSETQSLPLDSQGHYTAYLGATSLDGLPLNLFTSGQARWLGVQPELAGVSEQPRVLLVGVPYALKAADADTLGGKPPSAFVLSESPAPSGSTSATSAGDNTAATSVRGRTASPRADTQSPSAGTNQVGGSGTTNFIPIWTNSTTLGNSTLFQTGGKVGVVTTTPGATLDVKGSVRGSISTTSGTAVTGDANGTTGATVGVAGVTKSSSAGAIGVLGQATATSGVVFGVSGSSSSTTTNAAGVNGFESATTGLVLGVNGSTNSTTNFSAGVSGFEGATTGLVFGVNGWTGSTTTDDGGWKG
jgi:hypothetical protein